MPERSVEGGMLGKGLQLLVALGGHPEGAGLTRLATEVGLPASTAHRLLNAMVPAGFVSYADNERQYSLGLRVFELSHRVSLAQTLGAVALPIMRRLTEVSGEQTILSVRQDHELVYLEKVEGHHQLQNNAPVGGRGPLYCSAMGKALLAWLPIEDQRELVAGMKLERRGPNTITDPRGLLEELRLTRERGFSVNEEENEIGVRSVAVPVLDPRGRPACAICITAPVFRVTRETLDSHVPLLQELAREIEVKLPRGRAAAKGRGGGK